MPQGKMHHLSWSYMTYENADVNKMEIDMMQMVAVEMFYIWDKINVNAKV